jgi:hypothetical protein
LPWYWIARSSRAMTNKQKCHAKDEELVLVCREGYDFLIGVSFDPSFAFEVA